MENIDALLNLVISYQVIAYIALFLGMILEGEIVLILAGILLHLGAINFLPSIILILSGLVSKSFIAYNLGAFLRSRYPESKILKYIQKRVTRFFPHLEEKPFWSIFISKFLVSLNNFALIFAGYLKLKFKTYFKAEIFSNLLWGSIVISLGYFFSFTALTVTQEFKKFALIVILFIIGFIIIEKIVTFIYEIFEQFYHKHIKNSEDSKYSEDSKDSKYSKDSK